MGVVLQQSELRRCTVLYSEAIVGEEIRMAAKQPKEHRKSTKFKKKMLLYIW